MMEFHTHNKKIMKRRNIKDAWTLEGKKYIKDYDIFSEVMKLFKCHIIKEFNH